MVDELELAVYRKLASFGYRSSDLFSSSDTEASELYKAVQKLVIFCTLNRKQLSDELLNLIALTINGTVSNDQQLIRPQINDNALRIIYKIIKLLHDNKIHLWNGINSTLFNRNPTRIYIFPGQPVKPEWKFVFGEFAFLESSNPKHHFPLNFVQHVSHDIDHVLSMLQTFSNKVYFKGSLHEDYSGFPLCWFAPLPLFSRTQPRPICDSLNPFQSRYGCFRFILPFKSLIQRFPKCFILGTRKYNQEHSHTILLTTQDIEHIMLINHQQPRQITDTTFVRHAPRSSQSGNTEESFEWLCFNDDTYQKWDQLEFAIATNEVVFDPIRDSIRLDFVDHHPNICVPSCRTHTPCQCKWNRIPAMKYFIRKLTEKHIDLRTFRQFFSEHAWDELIAIQQSL